MLKFIPLQERVHAKHMIAKSSVGLTKKAKHLNTQLQINTDEATAPITKDQNLVAHPAEINSDISAGNAQLENATATTESASANAGVSSAGWLAGGATLLAGGLAAISTGASESPSSPSASSSKEASILNGPNNSIVAGEPLLSEADSVDPVIVKESNAIIGGTITDGVYESGGSKQIMWIHAPNHLTITDINEGEDHFQAGAFKGQYGSVSLSEDGTWFYSVDNSNIDVELLNDGEALTDTVTVYSADGTAQELTITIKGVTDVTLDSLPPINEPNAVIGGDISDFVIEAGAMPIAWMHAPNQLKISDVDEGQDHFQAGEYQGQFGSVWLNEDGTWSYSLDNSNVTVDKLNQGDTLTDVITVYSADGTAQDLSILINGSDDTMPQPEGNHNAVIGGTTTSVVYEQGVIHVMPLLMSTADDVPLLDTVADDIVVSDDEVMSTDLPIFTMGLDENGNAVCTDDGVVTLDDETLVDDPVIEDPVVVICPPIFFEGLNYLTINDADEGENYFQAGLYKGSFGAVQLNDDGSWYYVVDDANPTVDALNNGESLVDTITVYSIDGTAQDLSITINGADDAMPQNAIIGGVVSDSVIEAGSVMICWMHVPNHLTITDANAGEDYFQAGDYYGQFGSVSLSEDGTWFYGVDNSNPVVDALNYGETLTDVVTVFSADGTAQDLTITINGSNDEPLVCIDYPAPIVPEQIIISYNDTHTLDQVQDDLANLGQVAGVDFDSANALGDSGSTFVLHIVNDGSLNWNTLNTAIEQLRTDADFKYVEADQIISIDPIEYPIYVIDPLPPEPPICIFPISEDVAWIGGTPNFDESTGQYVMGGNATGDSNTPSGACDLPVDVIAMDSVNTLRLPEVYVDENGNSVDLSGLVNVIDNPDVMIAICTAAPVECAPVVNFAQIACVLDNASPFII